MACAALSGCGGGGGGGGGNNNGAGAGNPSPAPSTFSVGGTVSGLTGQGLILQVNGGGNLAVSANGGFTFASALADGVAYSVSVLEHPARPAQTCAVTNATGTLSSRAVNDINVTCSTRSFSVGGTISGLIGTLVARNNASDQLTITSNGNFTFGTPVLDGTAFGVTIVSSPARQQCAVSSGSGTIASGNVSTINILCSPPAFTVGGTVTGLLGAGLILQSNGSTVTVDASLPFAFPSGLNTGGTYDVTIQSAPAGHACNVLNGTGTIGNSDVTNVQVMCSVPLTLGYSIRQLKYSWPSVAGATRYELWGSQDSAPLINLATLPSNVTNFSLEIAVHRFRWATARYQLRACSVSCTSSNEVSPAGASARAIGYFKSSNSGLFDDFGAAVAISADGSTMAVGAPFERSAATEINGDQNDDTARDAGAVYVFVRMGTSWVQQAYVKASNAESGDEFGASVDLSDDGNTLVVGAIGEDSSATGVNGNAADNSAQHAGAAYVFTRTQDSWSQQAYVKASNTDMFDDFGFRVVVSGDGNTLGVNAKSEESNATGINGNQTDDSMPASGAVYVYTRSAGTWSQQAYIKASNTGTLDSFGVGLALNENGSTLAAGAPLEQGSATGVNGQQNDSAGLIGAVYVFTRTGTTWAQQSYIKPSNTYTDGFQMGFGRAVALSADGNTLAVGAPSERSSATLVDGDQYNVLAFTAGAVYVFGRAATQWSQHAYIKASNTDAEDFFGHALALSGDGRSLVVASAPESSEARGIDGAQGNSVQTRFSGAAYLYTNPSGLWQFQAYVKSSNTRRNYEFGTAVALSADGQVLAVGSPGEQSNATGIDGDQDDTSSPSGAVYLY